jgi:hypothetical protein
VVSIYLLNIGPVLLAVKAADADADLLREKNTAE